jgi:arginase
LARLGLIGFCSDKNSSFLRGSAEAPPLIREALFSDASNLWSENGTDLGGDEIFFEAGDVSSDSRRAFVPFPWAAITRSPFRS